MFNIPQITPEHAKNKALTDGFVIIDVREDNEIKYTNLSKISIPYTHIKMGEIVARIDELPKDKELGILCHHGNRSAQVTQFLRKKGFNAINIQGGIENRARTIDLALPRY
jgi:rhodanese-related sulfurtransferase